MVHRLCRYVSCLRIRSVWRSSDSQVSFLQFCLCALTPSSDNRIYKRADDSPSSIIKQLSSFKLPATQTSSPRSVLLLPLFIPFYQLQATHPIAVTPCSSLFTQCISQPLFSPSALPSQQRLLWRLVKRPLSSPTLFSFKLTMRVNRRAQSPRKQPANGSETSWPVCMTLLYIPLLREKKGKKKQPADSFPSLAKGGVEFTKPGANSYEQGGNPEPLSTGQSAKNHQRLIPPQQPTRNPSQSPPDDPYNPQIQNKDLEKQSEDIDAGDWYLNPFIEEE